MSLMTSHVSTYFCPPLHTKFLKVMTGYPQLLTATHSSTLSSLLFTCPTSLKFLPEVSNELQVAKANSYVKEFGSYSKIVRNRQVVANYSGQKHKLRSQTAWETGRTVRGGLSSGQERSDDDLLTPRLWQRSWKERPRLRIQFQRLKQNLLKDCLGEKRERMKLNMTSKFKA